MPHVWLPARKGSLQAEMLALAPGTLPASVESATGLDAVVLLASVGALNNRAQTLYQRGEAGEALATDPSVR